MNKNKGFTLIELMIVVAIIAILAAIAYPSYQGAIRDTRRGVAQADLVELAGFMERYYTTNSKYTDAAIPFNESPQEGGAVYYNLSVTIPSATTFVLVATPAGSQATDYCGVLTLEGTDKKTAVYAGSIVAGCW